jgi:PAS domain S-box-containing protein
MEPWLAELHRSDDRLRAVIESSPLAIMEVELEKRVIRWNRAAERIFGWRREEMLGRPGTPMVPPSKQAEHEELAATVRAGESYTGYQTVRRRKDGTVFEVMMAAAPVQDATGRVVSHVVVYNDISEGKQQEERLQALIDSSPPSVEPRQATNRGSGRRRRASANQKATALIAQARDEPG